MKWYRYCCRYLRDMDKHKCPFRVVNIIFYLLEDNGTKINHKPFHPHKSNKLQNGEFVDFINRPIFAF